MTIQEQDETARLSLMEKNRKSSEEAARAKLVAEGKDPEIVKNEDILDTFGWLCVIGALFIPTIGLAGLTIGAILASKPEKAARGASIIVLSVLVATGSSIYWFDQILR